MSDWTRAADLRGTVKMAPPQSPAARRFRVHQATNGRCWYCGEPSDVEDHIVSVSRGGLSQSSNLLPACRSCNSAKGPRSVEELRKTREKQSLGMPWFSREQTDWLKAHGFVFPRPNRHVFWGEVNGFASLITDPDYRPVVAE